MSDIEIPTEALLDKGFLELLNQTPESIDEIREERELKVENSRLAGKILREYQENIKASELDKEAILKGILSGEPISTLFYRALSVIGRLTGDDTFITTARERGLFLYEAYNDKETLEELLEDAKEKIERLREAKNNNTDSSRDNLIDRAIKRHEERVRELLKKIEVS